MKITILPVANMEQQPDKVTLYNLIKRSQEDLLYTIPELLEVILEIKVYPSFTRYNGVAKASYQIAEDMSSIALLIASYPGKDPLKIYETLSGQLLRIKNLD